MRPPEERRRTRYEDPTFGALISALRLVAADPKDQEQALPALAAVAEDLKRGRPPSTLALRVEEGEAIEGRVRKLLSDMDTTFEALAAKERKEAFTRRALDRDPEWATLRRLAREALAELGVPRRPPPPIASLG